MPPSPVPGAPVRLACVAEPDALPPPAASLLSGDDFFSSLAWYRVVSRHGVPKGTAARFAVAWSAERVLGVFPLLFGPRDCLGGLTTPYTCLYRPPLAPGLGAPEAVAACRAVALRCRSGVVRFDALPADEFASRALAAGARRAGLLPLRHDHFAAWQERVQGLDWATYLARRPGELRSTLRRKERQHGAALGFRLVRDGAELEPGIAAFEAVYGRSWKPPEPFPTFNAALMREAAAWGALRLGLLLEGEVPVAAQFWVVWRGHATVLKLAHDTGRDALSPGTLLTARMTKVLLGEGVSVLDFGRGDDPYKRRWVTERTVRIGLSLANPLRAAGAAAVLRHAAGALRRSLRPPAPGP